MIDIKKNKFPLIAACCYALPIIYSIVNALKNLKQINGYKIYPSTIVSWIIAISFVVSLVIEKKEAIICAAAATGIYYGYYIVINLKNGFTNPYQIGYLTASISLIVLLALSIKKDQKVDVLWMIPFVLFLVCLVIYWIKSGLFSLNKTFLWFCNRLMEILRSATFLFTGLWLKVSATPAESNEFTTFDPNTLASDNTTKGNELGGADRLKQYKELFDAGALSEEEFETIKRQILGI